jgi:hypothetical protein
MNASRLSPFRCLRLDGLIITPPERTWFLVRNDTVRSCSTERSTFLRLRYRFRCGGKYTQSITPIWFHLSPLTVWELIRIVSRHLRSFDSPAWSMLNHESRITECRIMYFTFCLNFSPRMLVKSKINYETGGRKGGDRYAILLNLGKEVIPV